MPPRPRRRGNCNGNTCTVLMIAQKGMEVKIKYETVCPYCEEPICDEACIDLREFGLGCFHKECAKKDDDVADLAMEILLDDYHKYMDMIEEEQRMSDMFARLEETA